MIHSFPHLIAGTDTQVAPPPASTGEPGYTCSAKYLFNLPIFQSLHFTDFQVMIHSFPHLIAGTDTQVAPPPASTGEPGYTCSAKYLFNLPIFQSLHFTAFQVMMIHSFPLLLQALVHKWDPLQPALVSLDILALQNIYLTFQYFSHCTLLLFKS